MGHWRVPVPAAKAAGYANEARARAELSSPRTGFVSVARRFSTVLPDDHTPPPETGWNNHIPQTKSLFPVAMGKGLGMGRIPTTNKKPLPGRNRHGAFCFLLPASSFLLLTSASSGFVGQIINHINLGDDAAHSI